MNWMLIFCTFNQRTCKYFIESEAISTTMDKITSRILISFDDICPFQCKHCYTLDIQRENNDRSVDDIVNSLKDTTFDIVYISQRRENFVNPDKGLALCEKVFEHYHCNIFLITRNVFTAKHIERLKNLKIQMSTLGKRLLVGVSIFATQSYFKSENPNLVPSPYARMNFLSLLSKDKFDTITIIRPVFPRKIIPIEELYEIVDYCKNIKTCIVSSGLAVNENILWRLGMNSSEFNYIDNAPYLEGAMEGDFKFVNVSEELNMLREYCQLKNIAFFEHTIQAINSLSEG